MIFLISMKLPIDDLEVDITVTSHVAIEITLVFSTV